MTLITKPVHKIWWLWAPAALMAIQIVIESVLSSDVLLPMHTEGGIHEMIQFLLLAAAFLLAVRMLLLPQLKGRGWLKAWIALAAVCCFYVAGEEVSWGQHILGWTTPDFWSHYNDQNETNFHNTSSWLDQKPRLVLEIGVVIGGIIIPLLLRYKPSVLPARFAAIYPSWILMPTAIFAVAVKIIDKINGGMEDIVLFTRASEVLEIYLYYFVLLYLVDLYRRILQDQR